MSAVLVLVLVAQLPDAGVALEPAAGAPPAVIAPADAGSPAYVPESRPPGQQYPPAQQVPPTQQYPPAQPYPPAQQYPPVATLPAAAVDAGVPNNGLTVRVGLESGLTSWPSGSPQDLFFDLRPLVSFDAGDDFGVDLAPTFHLRLIDDPPQDRSRDIGGILRRNDWDEASDFGQIIRNLRVGKLDSSVWARVGAVQLKTLGLGHVINRYSNQDNPNYHPASGAGGLLLGPVRAEFFASDVLGARIFAGLAGVELGRIISSDPKWQDRFWLTLEVAHDVGQAGGVSPNATILQLDFSALLYRSKAARVQTFAGVGSRVGGNADFGAVGGLSADADLDGFLLAGKLEARKQAGGYRQGFFGPQYEISRFVGAGFSGVPLAEQVLPDAFSFYGELRVGSRGFLVLEAAAEHYTWGRTDLDLSLNGEMFGSRFVTSARFTGVALGVLPRYAIYADARFRIFKSFYALASGGTLFFPQPLGTLTRGVFISAGAGVDFETML